MSRAVDRLRDRARAISLVQAARTAEALAMRAADAGTTPPRIGEDMPPEAEPMHFVASDRMALVLSELSAVTEGSGGQLQATANIMGLAGATPALPPFYSELQLQRRRARDPGIAAFLALFDHRALSFFYRIARKYHWLLDHERDDGDAITDALLSFAGLPTAATRQRMGLEDAALAPLAHHLGDVRRSAQGLETVLRHVLRRPLRVIEAEPVWMALPADEQTRLGGAGLTPGGGFARLGGDDPDMTDDDEARLPDAALIGAAVLDVQHHYVVEIGPLDYAELLAFCTDAAVIDQVRELCLLAAGIAQRPILRMAIPAGQVPPLQLGADEAPALLGRTTWMAVTALPETILTDCAIPLAIGG